MPPISVMKIETTPAKIGRSTKKTAKFMAAYSVAASFEPALFVRCGAAVPRAHLRPPLGPGPRPQQAVDDDLVVGRQAFANDAHAVVGRTDTQDLDANRPVFPHHQPDLPRLVG